MKTLLIAAAAIATLGAALPASAQTWDRGHAAPIHARYVAPRFERARERYVSPWELRRLEERRRLELRFHHDGFRDSGYGYRR